MRGQCLAQKSQQNGCNQQMTSNDIEIYYTDDEQFQFRNLDSNNRDEVVYFHSEESTSDRENFHSIKEKDFFYINEMKEFNDLIIEEEEFKIDFQDASQQNENNHLIVSNKINQSESKHCSNKSDSNKCVKSKKKIQKFKDSNQIPQFNNKSKLLPQATKNIYKNLVRALSAVIKWIPQYEKYEEIQQFLRKDGQTGKSKIAELIQTERGKNICSFFFKQNKFVFEFLKNNKTNLSDYFRMIPDFAALCE